MTYQEIVKAIASLPVAERDSLLELIRQQQIEQRRDEVHYIDRDGNPLNYHIKDLYPTEVGYDYVTSQGKNFDICLPDLASKYAGKYVVFEDGQVIDSDLDEDVLLNRIWHTEFAISRRDRYHGIFCELVPEKLNA